MKNLIMLAATSLLIACGGSASTSNDDARIKIVGLWNVSTATSACPNIPLTKGLTEFKDDNNDGKVDKLINPAGKVIYVESCELLSSEEEKTDISAFGLTNPTNKANFTSYLKKRLADGYSVDIDTIFVKINEFKSDKIQLVFSANKADGTSTATLTR